MPTEFKRLLLNLLTCHVTETGAMRNAGFAVYVCKFKKDYPSIESERLQTLVSALYGDPSVVAALCRQWLGEERKS